MQILYSGLPGTLNFLSEFYIFSGFINTSSFYFYNKFILKFKINLIILFDYKYLLNYDHDFKLLNVVFFYIKSNFLPTFDYWINFKNNFFNKFLFFIILNNIYYIFYNYNFYKYKIFYLNNLNNFIN